MLEKKTAGVKEMNKMLTLKVWDDCGIKLPKSQDFTGLHTTVSTFCYAQHSEHTRIWKLWCVHRTLLW